METSTIVLDTSILIDFFRKRNKANSVLFRLIDDHQFCISVITAFEIQIGIKTERQLQDYQVLLENIQVLPIDTPVVDQAVDIYKHLKRRNAQIGLADLLIGATARRHNLSVATLNLKHFDRIPQINLIITSEE